MVKNAVKKNTTNKYFNKYSIDESKLKYEEDIKKTFCLFEKI